MENHPKADKLFNKAWDFGSSLGYEVIENYFFDLIDLLEEETSININKSDLFNLMVS